MKVEKEKSRFWLERIYVNKQMPIHIYDASGVLVDTVGTDDSEEDPLRKDPGIYTRLFQKWKTKKYPLLEVEDDWIIYFAFADEEEKFYIGGPASIKNMQQQMYGYRRKHNLSKNFTDISEVTLMQAANLLSIALGVMKNQYIEEIELLEKNGLSESKQEGIERDLLYYRYKSAEQGIEHYKYESERNMLEGIREGNVEQFEKVSYKDANAMDNIGKLAQNEKKQIEYMTVITITLTGRAAIEGGVPAAEMYAVSDVFLQKLEKCTDVIDMIKLNRDVQKKFVRLVRNHKNKKKEAYYIEQSKELIARNIHKRLTVEEIAQQIGINRTYLSTRFSENVGMTISQYNILIRLNAAENMLKYSDMAISQIAEYLCFSSQSYFGKVFKEKNKLTPVKFRQCYKVVDF